jgi:hypothetical protein
MRAKTFLPLALATAAGLAFSAVAALAEPGVSSDKIVFGQASALEGPAAALGNPVAPSLTPGQAADISQAEPLLEALEPGAVIANKGYDAYALVKTLEECNITPSSRQRPTASNSARVTSRSIESA